ncbi:MAG TPA: sugar ABC transporter ATP-binding protein [Actinomycetota bacterium]|nr:sugar ABC transporter ATP-binding protein [Actinomycetota bacterium]
MSEAKAPGSVLLKVTGLTKHYPGVVALNGVDFDVRSGEVHCLLGQNGAGKSTLIKTVSGLIAPTSGEITFAGEQLGTGDTHASLVRGIATIYQELDLVTDLSVSANVWLGHEAKRGPLLQLGEMVATTKKLLNRLDHGHIDPRDRVADLSPASQQIVSIARALSREVRLLIMDEPSAVLDDQEIETLFSVVRRLTAEGVGVIYISHRLDEVERIADRVTVLKDGQTVISGVPATTPPDDLVRAMVGRAPEEITTDRAPAKDELILEVRDLMLPPHVRGVSFGLKKGEILGIAGLVGSGRSELLRVMYGLEKPDSGEVLIEGRSLRPGRPDIAMAAGLGLAPEDRKSQGLLMEWNSIKNVSISDLQRFARGPLIDTGAERKAVATSLDAIGAQPGAIDRFVRELSGGNQQKVVLARWLLKSCKVLLLDEPTRGVDVGAKTEIYNVISGLAAQGLGIVMVSSELSELLGFCDRILVLRDGQCVHEAPGSSITEEEILNLVVRSEPVAARGA